MVLGLGKRKRGSRELLTRQILGLSIVTRTAYPLFSGPPFSQPGLDQTVLDLFINRFGFVDLGASVETQDDANPIAPFVRLLRQAETRADLAELMPKSRPGKFLSPLNRV
jgi:hypothetical protein